MLPLFESLLPIFLLIMLGLGLRRSGLAADVTWPGMERISYYVFFPALIVQTLYRADFSSFAAAGVAAGFATGIVFLLGAMLALRRPIEAAIGISPASYSSVYQSVTRWNAFVVLAIAEKLHGPHEMAIVAIAIGAMIIPINVVNVAVVTALGEREGARPNFIGQIVTNPLILGVIAGLLLNWSGVELPEAIATTLELVARISLPIGLLLVGAGLNFAMSRSAVLATLIATALKLFAMPAVLVAAAWLFGVRGQELTIVALCGAGPSAMNGYLVARALGGDAPLFAATVTLQTILCFLTLPLVTAVTAYLAG